ncbi:MAG: PIN domain-containing protein [Archangium sp.]|nr:PIN domain-containing protein [Archangium sp.]
MRGELLLDTGPLVALLNPRDRHHRWAVEALAVRARVITCESVLSEAFFLLSASSRASAGLRGMLSERALEVAKLSDELGPITKLMGRYANVPMSLADSCLVRLSELFPKGVVATIDSDLLVYRRFGRQVIPVLMP